MEKKVERMDGAARLGGGARLSVRAFGDQRSALSYLVPGGVDILKDRNIATLTELAVFSLS